MFTRVVIIPTYSIGSGMSPLAFFIVLFAVLLGLPAALMLLFRDR